MLQHTQSADRTRMQTRRTLWALLCGVVALLVPAAVYAHERWLPNTPRWPVNKAYFQNLEGPALALAVAGTLSLIGVVIAFFLIAPAAVERLTPVTEEQRNREAHLNPAVRWLRAFLRLFLDGHFSSRALDVGLDVAIFIFSKIPAPVLFLGAYQGFLVMPSYPVEGTLGMVIRVVSVILGIWVLIGKKLNLLGIIMFVIWGYLCIAYGIAGIDAIPVLASAFFYTFMDEGQPGVNAKQLLGIRLSLGVGFFLLGLVDKIYLSQFIIGVADQYPQILTGPQAQFPGLSREQWAYSGAVGEMVFGLLVLAGTFNRAVNLILAFIFSNFMLVFGWAEIVHVYPIAGFVILFFRGPIGSPLDGPIFNLSVKFSNMVKGISFAKARGMAVVLVASLYGLFLMFIPTVFFVEVLPNLDGGKVPEDFVPLSNPPPAETFMGTHPPRHGGLVTRVGEHEVEIIVEPDGDVEVYAATTNGRPVRAGEMTGKFGYGHEGAVSKDMELMAGERGGSAALTGKAPALTADTDFGFHLMVEGEDVEVVMPILSGGTEAMLKSDAVHR